MKIISLNVNGIRAAHKKGLFEWLQQAEAEVICIQETKAQSQQLSEEIMCPPGYTAYYNDALKKGYSGVALYSRKNRTKFMINWAGPPRMRKAGLFRLILVRSVSSRFICLRVHPVTSGKI